MVSRTLAQLLSSFQGGSDSRILETTGKLQILWNFSESSVAEGNTDLSVKDNPLYVGLESTMHRVECENGKERKKEENCLGEKRGKKIENRRIEDGLLLVVFARIYGKTVRTLIDSGATRCFVTPTCVATVGLKGMPCGIFLELGNGEKYLSRGYVPDVPVVTTGLTVKIGLIVTNLLHEVDMC